MGSLVLISLRNKLTVVVSLDKRNKRPERVDKLEVDMLEVDMLEVDVVGRIATCLGREMAEVSEAKMDTSLRAHSS